MAEAERREKQPIYIRMRESAPFAFGRLWKRWEDAQRVVESFCIVTTAPNDLCRMVHDRMPLVLREEDFAAWLDVNAGADAVAGLLRPYAADRMECYPLASLVNKVQNETKSRLERLEASARGQRDSQLMLFQVAQ